MLSLGSILSDHRMLADRLRSWMVNPLSVAEAQLRDQPPVCEDNSEHAIFDLTALEQNGIQECDRNQSESTCNADTNHEGSPTKSPQLSPGKSSDIRGHPKKACDQTSPGPKHKPKIAKSHGSQCAKKLRPAKGHVIENDVIRLVAEALIDQASSHLHLFRRAVSDCDAVVSAKILKDADVSYVFSWKSELCSSLPLLCC